MSEPIWIISHFLDIAVDVAQCESTHKIEITQVNYFELA